MCTTATAGKPSKCYGPKDGQHRRGCRATRPACRWRRRAAGLCQCEAYHFIHRAGGGACRVGIPAAILKSKSYRAA